MPFTPVPDRTDIQKIGGYAALYLAATYIVLMTVFLLVFKYTPSTTAAQKLQLLSEKTNVFYATNFLAYVLFGPALVLLVLGLRERMRRPGDWMMSFAAILGVIWAGSLAASGMVANAGISPVLDLLQQGSPQALTLWQGLEAVSTGLGNGNGEILGGLFTLFVSLAAMRTGAFHRLINALGIITGAVGILSVLPVLTGSLGSIFGLLQIVWFIGVAVALLGTAGRVELGQASEAMS